MKKSTVCLLILASALMAGCAKSERSISHSGYVQQGSYFGGDTREAVSDPAFEYKGELSENDVLGIARSEFTSEADIRRALEAAKPVKLQQGTSILLIQSGSLFPDSEMVTQLGKHYRVVPFSGVPTVRRLGSGALQTENPDPEMYSKTLRLTAARGGTDFIICYWGMLESESDRLPTKAVSWLPIVNWFTPDEKQHMRIQLKVALVDVRSGNWSVFSPKPFADSRITTSPRKGAVDQKQVELLKKLAYEASVNELVQSYN